MRCVSSIQPVFLVLRARFLLSIWLALVVNIAGHAADDAGGEFFVKRVRPILVARRYECHSEKAEKLKGGLRLDSRAAALKGGDTGPAVVPGKTKESLLVDAINYGELYQMPPKSRLPAKEVAALTKWVEMGVPWPEAERQETGERKHRTAEIELAQRKAEHWCWQPIKGLCRHGQNPKSSESPWTHLSWPT